MKTKESSPERSKGSGPQITSSDMLNQELSFYSLDPQLYEKHLKENGFKILLREYDQEHHLVWIAQHEG